MKDYVVLVDHKNTPLGTAPKLAVHSANTPLHRGFSLFLFGKYGELLLQQRSHKKKTWPLSWSNSCCGHPMLGETPINAAKRRLEFELGISDATITMVLHDYRYRCEKDGIVENEICPVMVGFSSDKPMLNPDEVEKLQWMDWGDWLKEVKNNPSNYSEWCVEETLLLEKNKTFQELLRTNGLR